MQEYINGCYTKYGSRALKKEEIVAKGKLPNNLWMVFGFINTKEDGFSIDVYKDEKLTECIFWEHGIITSVDINNINDADLNMLATLAMNRCLEMGL